MTPTLRAVLLSPFAPPNLLTYTEQLDNAAWEKTRSTVEANSLVDPYTGASTVDKLVEDTSIGTNHYTSKVFAATAGLSYWLVFYAKEDGRNIVVEFAGSGFGANKQATFNLAAGTASGLTGVTAFILPVGGGYQCVAGCDSTVSGSTAVYFILADGTNTSYTGDGTSGAFIGRAMLNDGTRPGRYRRHPL